MSRTSRFNNKFIILRNFQIGYDFRFDPIKAYLESTQEMIRDQEKGLEKKFNEWNEKHAEMPDAFDIYEMEILNSSEFPNILNKSIYLTIYSMFENEFNKLCEWCQHAEDLNLEPKDLKGRNYIGQCRSYIIKVLNVNLDNLNEQWEKIGKYQKIRNVIAHNNGIVKQGNTEIRTFLNNKEGVSIEQKTSEIQISSVQFLNELIDHLVKFLNNTIEEIITQKEKSSI